MTERTIPPTPQPGQRYAIWSDSCGGWEVLDWEPDIGGELAPCLVAGGLSEADARLMVHGGELLAAARNSRCLLRRLGGKNHDPEYSELEAAIAAVKGE